MPVHCSLTEVTSQAAWWGEYVCPPGFARDVVASLRSFAQQLPRSANQGTLPMGDRLKTRPAATAGLGDFRFTRQGLRAPRSP